MPLHFKGLKVIQSGLKYRTAKPLYAQCTELDADSSYDGNDLERR